MLQPRHLLFNALVALLLGWPLSGHAGLSRRLEADVPHELLPELRSEQGTCVPTLPNTLRALVAGVGEYPEPYGLRGPAEDASLVQSVLEAQGAQVTVLRGRVTRAAFVHSMMDLARQSRCGDSVLVYFSGHSSLRAPNADPSHLEYLFSDVDIHDLDTATQERLPLRGSPQHRVRLIWPGAVDANELQDYFDRTRANGLNVVFISDTHSNINALSERTRPAEYWIWNAAGEDTVSEDTQPQGAFFGFYAGSLSLEVPLPSGKGGTPTVHGLFTWAIVAALREHPGQSFRELAHSIAGTMKDQAAQTRTEFEMLAPTFVATRPDLSPWSTGLISARAGATALRGGDARRVELTYPVPTRGYLRVGVGNLLIQGRVIAPTPPKVVEANQVRGRVNPDGSFELHLAIAPGETRVMLVAWWGDNDFLPYTFTVVSQQGERLIQEGQRYALLIAVQAYVDPAFATLATPLADSRELATLLERRYGFRTRIPIGGREISLTLSDADRLTITHTLALLRSVLTEEDSLLIYFAGHGIYEKETDRAYWVPHDAQREDSLTMISDSDVQAAIERLNVRHVLIIADSCFSGAFRTRGVDSMDAATMSRIQFLDQSNLRHSRAFMASGAAEPVVDQGGRGHSAFAQALLDGLRAEAHPFTAGELFEKHIRPQVGGTTHQLPQYFPMKGDDEGGQFVFVPMGAAP